MKYICYENSCIIISSHSFCYNIFYENGNIHLISAVILVKMSNFLKNDCTRLKNILK